MPRRANSITPHVLIAGTIIAIMTGAVAVRIVNSESAGGRVYLFVMNVVYWSIWTGLAPAVLLLGRRVPFVAGRRGRALVFHAASGVGFAAVHLALITAAAVALRWWIFAAPAARTLAQLRPQFPTRLHIEWELTMYWALVGLAQAMAFRAEAQERALRAAQLESRLAQAQLQALQRQLQPHFLFNTLQTISALVHRDVREADRMIERLGDLLRMTLGAGDVAEVSLARELEHVRHYVTIEQANMGRRLVVTIDVAPDALACAVPSLLLQPLVENSVRHGLAPLAAGGHVRISAVRSGAHALELRVQDDGVGLRGSSGAPGIGIENTRQRLRQLYGDAHRFDVAAPPDGGVVVSITLPFRAVADAVACEVAG